jgi:hypothetical protein
MNKSKLTTKRTLWGVAAVVVVLGSAGANWADAGPGGPSPVPIPIPADSKVPSNADLPDVAVREITRPGGERQVYAMFRNGKVYRITEPIKVFEVDKGHGVKATRTVPTGDYAVLNDDGSTSPVPPWNRALLGVRPTPEQEAEMDRIAGVHNPPEPPPGGFPPGGGP